MTDPFRRILPFAALALAVAAAPRARAEEPAPREAPFAYVQARAFHVLPETHSEESGYFSLSEAQDGSLHIGTAQYGRNCHLVEFDPRSGKQRVVVDVHRDLGLTETGYAAQAKIHTRNSVGRSGKIYAGTKQGYPTDEDKKQNVAYPGGYVLSYDPRTGEVENLGMPYPRQGVIDVAADEERDALYVVTCEDQHWMRYDLGTRTYRELGPMLTPYATTLVDAKGGANVITKDFQLARFDPATGTVASRPITLNGTTWTRADDASIPTWQLAADGRTAYLVLMNDPTLLEIDLLAEGGPVQAVSHGKLLAGEGPDSRCALSIAPDGRIYAVVRIDNKTGFGEGYLHHLVRFDPQTGTSTDLGVLAVENPGFFDFATKKPWTHGYHTLPDGTLTPLHHHMALLAARDGSLYVTILCPFTLLKIDAFQTEAPEPAPSRDYLRAALDGCDRIEADLDRIVTVAEEVARRYDQGGLVGFPYIRQTLGAELYGRSGGLMHAGFDRPWKEQRTAAEERHDVAIFGWDSAPEERDLEVVRTEKERGAYVIGFGPKAMPELRPHVELADAWFDTGRPADDRVVTFPDGSRAGKINHLLNAAYAWTLTGETVGALTRLGRMPTMWKSWAFKDGREWSDPLFGKKQYHDDFRIAPVAAGHLGRAYLRNLRYLLHRFERTELEKIANAAELVAAERAAGRKTVIASSGHMAMSYVARYDDADWAVNQEVHAFLDTQMEDFEAKTADGALVVRLGESGFHQDLAALFKRKKQKVILLTAENPYPENRAYLEAGPLAIGMGYAFGDACVPLRGYPIRILPVSGVMQVAAYECLNVEVFARRRSR